jgi:hypothetical protein
LLAQVTFASSTVKFSNVIALGVSQVPMCSLLSRVVSWVRLKAGGILAIVDVALSDPMAKVFADT